MIYKHVVIRAKRVFRSSTAVRYIAVGGVNTLSSYLVYLIFLGLGCRFYVANLGSLVFGVCVGFLLQGRLVFGVRDGRRFLPFVACWTIIYFMQLGLLWLLVTWGVAPAIGGLLILPPVWVLGFVMQKMLVFRQHTVL